MVQDFAAFVGEGCGAGSPLSVAMTEDAREIMALVAGAVRDNRLELAWQPVVLSRDPGCIAFHEGLMRMLGPAGRIIPARAFMATIEAHELGREIDCAALEIGLAALNRHPGLRISVNMSARSIGYPRWTRTLQRGLAQGATVGERLILEMTESSALLVPELVIRLMADLQGHGVAFALDDFGAGFTAIRHFRDFLFDIVKIDGQFIRDIDRNPDNRAVTSALLSIGRQFEMVTVAEAVETVAEAECLRALGVDCQQGYLHGAPTTRPLWMAPPRARAG
jgi:EAL domain-containing protein (putative c-di-GMP-specific phosphodiesterase class I)